MYLGRNYSLQIIVDQKKIVTGAKLFRGKLYVYVYTSTNKEAVIRQALESWYKKKARQKIGQRIQYYQSYFDVKPTKLVISNQQKRWGSCTKDYGLRFNFTL